MNKAAKNEYPRGRRWPRLAAIATFALFMMFIVNILVGMFMPRAERKRSIGRTGRLKHIQTVAKAFAAAAQRDGDCEFRRFRSGAAYPEPFAAVSLPSETWKALMTDEGHPRYQAVYAYQRVDDNTWYATASSNVPAVPLLIESGNEETQRDARRYLCCTDFSIAYRSLEWLKRDVANEGQLEIVRDRSPQAFVHLARLKIGDLTKFSRSSSPPKK